MDKLAPLAEMIAYQPELIVLNEWVSAKEGTVLCQEIKAVHRLAHVLVVIISTSPDIAQIAMACQADGAVSKPLMSTAYWRRAKGFSSPQ